MDQAQFRKQIKELSETCEEIKKHGGTGNEEFAKQYLILPMLKNLGYKTDGFPPEVRPEQATNADYKSSGPKCRVDYAVYLQNAQKPCIYIEAKSLDTNLDSQSPIQELASYFLYCDEVQLGILTNGRDYRLFIAQEGKTSRMNMTPILTFSIDELLMNDDKLTSFLRYAHKDNVIARIGNSGKSIADLYKEDQQRSNLFDVALNLLLSDDELDGEFVKYLSMRAGISFGKWTDARICEFRPKVKDAINRVVKKIETDYLTRFERSRADINDDKQSDSVNVGEVATSDSSNEQSDESSVSQAIEEDDENTGSSGVITTELELQIVDKVQAMIDASDLPKKLWSNDLNDWMPTQVKYKDTTFYMGMFIHYLSNDDLKSKHAPRSWAIRYGGQYDIEKGCIGFNCDNEQTLRSLIPSEFEILSGKGASSQVTSPQRVLIRSFEDLEKLKPAILYCFKNNIDAFIENNPRPN